MPAPASLELKGLIEAQKKAEQVLRDLDGTPLANAIRDGTLLVERTAKHVAHVDTGDHRANLTPELRIHGTRVEGIVGSNLAYAAPSVLGSRPHFPPIAAIQRWVHRKGLGGRVNARGKLTRRAPASVERGIAFLIARKISRKGTKGDRSLLEGLEQNAPRIMALVESAVHRIVED